jgi:hypothetical protein
VERGYDRNSQGSDEIEDVRAIVTAPNAEFVLKADDLHPALVERPRHVRVVGFDVAPDAMTYFGRVGAGLVGWVEGHDLTFAYRRGQVVREGRNAAPTRGVGGYEGGSRDEVLLSEWVVPLGERRGEARAIDARAAIASSGLGRGYLNGARALGARLDFERDTLAADEAVEVEGSQEAATMEEVFLAIFGGDESEAALGDDLLDSTGGHE